MSTSPELGAPAVPPPPEGGPPPPPDYFTVNDFRGLFEAHCMPPGSGARLFHALARGAGQEVPVSSFAEFDPDVLPPAVGAENPLVLLSSPYNPDEPETDSALTSAGILAALDYWLECGYPPASSPVLPEVGAASLASLAYIMSKLHPERPPYPLPRGFRPPLEPKPLAISPLLAVVAVGGLEHWVVTHRIIRDHAEERGMRPKQTAMAIPLVRRFAEKIVQRSGGELSLAERLVPGSFLGDSVIYMGPDTSEQTRYQPPMYGIAPGAFVQEYEAAIASPDGQSFYGNHTRGMISVYVTALRGLVAPSIQNPQA